MAVTHPAAVRNGVADYVVDLVDVSAPGSFLLRVSTTTLCDLPFGNPAFGAASAGVATANAVSSVDATAAGTADNFQVVDGAASVCFEGTISEPAGGGDIEITNTDINVGDPISITSLTYTAPS